MFCTSLRKRPSVAGVVAMFNSPAGLAFRESQLSTCDISIPLNDALDPVTGDTIRDRALRVLLLTSSDVDEEECEATLQRIHRFSWLTGGQDVAIVFLLNSNPPSHATGKEVVQTENVGNSSHASDGVWSFTKLQSILTTRGDIPHIPILSVAATKSLSFVLTNHASRLQTLAADLPKFSPQLELLKLCTANPPMKEQTAHILSDLFVNLQELASACIGLSSIWNSSSPSVRAARGSSSLLMDGFNPNLDMDSASSNTGASNKLRRLQDLVGARECQDIIDFWKEEWVLE